MTTNPEKHVLDAIDALVNEQLAVGPIDDYSMNYYPQCPQCGCDWHGEECQSCGCEQSTGEVLIRPGMRHHPLARREIDLNVLTDGALPYSELEEEWRRREGAIFGGGGGELMEEFVSDEEADQLDAVAGEFNRSQQRLNAVLDAHAHEHIHQLDAEGICVWADCPVQQQPPRGYTIEDLRAMQGRDWRRERQGEWSPYQQARYDSPRHISSIRQDYPQRYVLGEQGRPRVRFWNYDLETNQFCLVEGRAEVMHITWTRDGVTVEIRLEPYGELVVDEEDTHLRPASTPIPPGMIAMEGFQDGAFTTVGYLNPDDLTIAHNREWGRAAFGRDAALLQEDYRVTMAIPDDRIEPLRELLERGQ